MGYRRNIIREAEEAIRRARGLTEEQKETLVRQLRRRPKVTRRGALKEYVERIKAQARELARAKRVVRRVAR